jgi:hypothetical protein
MDAELRVPILSYEQIRKEANAFLLKYNPEFTVPVPIEEIVEFSLKMSIVPVPGLQRTLEVDGFISSDLRSITVDQFVMEERESRYRFTLAHEVGHAWLHKAVFGRFNFKTIEDWKNFQMGLTEEAYGWLEFQAYSFAGLVLVPKEQLIHRREAHENRIKAEKLNPNTDAAKLIVARSLAADFKVSPSVIEKRLLKDR